MLAQRRGRRDWQRRADLGIAIAPVANLYDLGFLPIAPEHYDFLVVEARRHRPAVRPLSRCCSTRRSATASARSAWNLIPREARKQSPITRSTVSNYSILTLMIRTDEACGGDSTAGVSVGSLLGAGLGGLAVGFAPVGAIKVVLGFVSIAAAARVAVSKH